MNEFVARPSLDERTRVDGSVCVPRADEAQVLRVQARLGVWREDFVHAGQASKRGENGNRDSIPECLWGC